MARSHPKKGAEPNPKTPLRHARTYIKEHFSILYVDWIRGGIISGLLFFVFGYAGNDKRFNIDRQVERTKTTEEEIEGPAS